MRLWSGQTSCAPEGRGGEREPGTVVLMLGAGEPRGSAGQGGRAGSGEAGLRPGLGCGLPHEQVGSLSLPRSVYRPLFLSVFSRTFRRTRVSGLGSSSEEIHQRDQRGGRANRRLRPALRPRRAADSGHLAGPPRPQAGQRRSDGGDDGSLGPGVPEQARVTAEARPAAARCVGRSAGRADRKSVV